MKHQKVSSNSCNQPKPLASGSPSKGCATLFSSDEGGIIDASKANVLLQATLDDLDSLTLEKIMRGCDGAMMKVLLFVSHKWNLLAKKLNHTGNLVEYAIRIGNLSLIKWALQNNFPYNRLRVCENAAWNGHFEVLKWARENGCPWNYKTCSYAAWSGHLEMLKWARENGCSWDGTTCAYAEISGHFEVLKWAIKNGCPWNKSTCSAVIKWS